MLALSSHLLKTVPVVATALAVGLLALVREALDLPKPLVLTVATIFVLCLAAGWTRWRTASRAVLLPALCLLAIWLGSSTVILSAIYVVDRAGWNWYRVTGYNVAWSEDLRDTMPSTAADVARRYPMFQLRAGEPPALVLPAGSHLIQETVVIPPGTELRIEPGARVQFSVGCSLISYSPILARGSSVEPIVFEPQHQWLKWGAIAVVGAHGSQFQFVQLQHGRYARVNEIDFPGGLNLIDADGEIAHCEFREMYGKDVIYVRHGHVVIRKNRLEQAFKDGIDFDDGSGIIRDNLIIDCEDEGIDLSGYLKIDVRNNTIRDRRGGRIAADHGLEEMRLANTLERSARN